MLYYTCAVMPVLPLCSSLHNQRTSCSHKCECSELHHQQQNQVLSWKICPILLEPFSLSPSGSHTSPYPQGSAVTLDMLWITLAVLLIPRWKSCNIPRAGKNFGNNQVRVSLQGPDFPRHHQGRLADWASLPMRKVSPVSPTLLFFSVSTLLFQAEAGSCVPSLDTESLTRFWHVPVSTLTIHSSWSCSSPSHVTPTYFRVFVIV